jgi:hypothetical protein
VVQRKPTATSRGAVGRKYVRDARGRFAGSGYTGQTSGKGARLMASGTRKGGGSKITLQKRGGTVAKSRGLKPQQGITVNKRKSAATSKLRPGELINLNARPRNVMAKPPKTDRTTFVEGKPKTNVNRMKALIKAQGVPNVDQLSRSHSRAAAWAQPEYKRVVVNSSNSMYKQPYATMLQNRRTGNLSTSDPRGTAFHEAAHLKYAQKDNWLGDRHKKVAGRVSRYAQMNPKEFVSEVVAGRRTGRKYDRETMRIWRDYAGLPAKVSTRRRSRIKRGST